MSGFKHALFRSLGLLGMVALVALGTLPAAQASPASRAAPTVKVPNACKSFSLKSGDALFSLKKGTHLSEKSSHSGTGSNETYTCLVKHGKLTLTILTSAFAGGYGGPLKCYKRPKLGNHGTICVGTLKKFQVTFVRFERHKIWFSDDFNKTLPHEGKALYTFALAQYKAYKG
ncbi:MAG: hypothetical protein ACLQFR_04775 [Streptosporangiaceae bacterium]